MISRDLDRDGPAACLDLAAECLAASGIVCFPTETFYALGARYDHETALGRIARLKGRPEMKPFPLIVGSPGALSFVVDKVEPLAQKIMEQFWPGPLTIVFAARAGLSPLLRDVRGTVAVRMPGPSFALELARRAGVPLTATSANRSGGAPGTSAAEVRTAFPEGLDVLIDGGMSTADKPSTIIETAGGSIRVIREGAVPAPVLARIKGP